MTVSERVLAVMENESGKVGLSDDFPIGMLGLDSLEFVQLMVAVRDIADIPDEAWARFNTVGEVLAAAEKHAISA